MAWALLQCRDCERHRYCGSSNQQGIYPRCEVKYYPNQADVGPEILKFVCKSHTECLQIGAARGGVLVTDCEIV